MGPLECVGQSPKGMSLAPVRAKLATGKGSWLKYTVSLRWHPRGAGLRLLLTWLTCYLQKSTWVLVLGCDLAQAQQHSLSCLKALLHSIYFAKIKAMARE